MGEGAGPSMTSIKLLVPSFAETAALGNIVRKGALKASEWYVRLVAETPAEGLKGSQKRIGPTQR